MAAAPPAWDSVARGHDRVGGGEQGDLDAEADAHEADREHHRSGLRRPRSASGSEGERDEAEAAAHGGPHADPGQQVGRGQAAGDGRRAPAAASGARRVRDCRRARAGDTAPASAAGPTSANTPSSTPATPVRELAAPEQARPPAAVTLSRVCRRTNQTSSATPARKTATEAPSGIRLPEPASLSPNASGQDAEHGQRPRSARPTADRSARATSGSSRTAAGSSTSRIGTLIRKTAPHHHADEQAADRAVRRGARGGDRAPDAERDGPLAPVGEHLPDDRERGRHDHRAADAEQRPGQDQRQRGGGEGGGRRRGDAEQDEPRSRTSRLRP